MARHGIAWEPASWLFPVVTGAFATAAAMVVLGRADLLVFAAPLIGGLAGGWWSEPPGRHVAVSAELSRDRVLENESVTLRLEITAPEGVEISDVAVRVDGRVDVERVSWVVGSGGARGEWTLTPRRWGRWTGRLELGLVGSAGLMVGTAAYQLPKLSVYPGADTVTAVPRPMELVDLLGAHRSRRRGEGVEFAGVRDFQAGDQRRSINWRVTARRGRLHVNERLAEQAAKVVVLVDAVNDIHQPDASTLELSVQGALAVVQGALRRGDRAGVVTVGGVIRWMTPGMGRRHLHRVVEALLDVQAGTGAAPADASAFPRAVLPPGAAVVVFSPLLDERVVGTVADLRRRGFGVVVVDVLRTEPRPRPNSAYDPIAVRMWRVGRRGLRQRLYGLGIPVGVWTRDTTLEEVLWPLTRRPLLGARR